MRWLEQLYWPGVSGLVEIAVLAAAIYYTLAFFRGTRGAHVLTGFAVIAILILLTRMLGLDALSWLLQRMILYFAAGFVIIFQPEIRRALAELGRQHMFGPSAGPQELVGAIVEAVADLSRRRIGALIAIEREIGTRAVRETGTALDALVSAEALSGLFYPHTPLHDGGAVIAGSRIAAAGCVFPISLRNDLIRSLGTRHRAAIGLSEETDAFVIVVSEETGTISIAYKGKLSRELDPERLRRILTGVLTRRPRALRSGLKFWRWSVASDGGTKDAENGGAHE